MAIKIYNKDNFVLIDDGSTPGKYISSSNTDFDHLGNGDFVVVNTADRNENYSFNWVDLEKDAIGTAASSEQDAIDHLTVTTGFKGATAASVTTVAADLAAHEADTANPHSVTVAQTGGIDKTGDTGITGSLEANSTGDLSIELNADTDNSAENDNAWVKITQDGGDTVGLFALNGSDGNLANIGSVADMESNSTVLYSSKAVNLAVGSQTYVRVDNTSRGIMELLGEGAFNYGFQLMFGDGFNIIEEDVDDHILFTSSGGIKWDTQSDCELDTGGNTYTVTDTDILVSHGVVDANATVRLNSVGTTSQKSTLSFEDDGSQYMGVIGDIDGTNTDMGAIWMNNWDDSNADIWTQTERKFANDKFTFNTNTAGLATNWVVFDGTSLGNEFVDISGDLIADTLKAAGTPVYDDDAAAGVGGLVAGQIFQTSGSGSAPLNAAGILMIKQ